ncbi:hypothetical protein BC939DRAFT_315606 [Gamsiella multidivaricata]|uniref:uncharacterized protein n=1 Tax=Gamsiella multidivaricata TaxID=101098 RepID=UPI002220EE60|nr:uncharacterized protein BC939DRAFT_315606 [Gamsiella multidivaricata]KAG0363382.1 hypothetical protein BGZ54_008185 [Gamsiella multidivaricata]KAI7817750.1 hypothetical protein BC939DRAFT_315606 [Gamsiella multidivaricata]
MGGEMIFEHTDSRPVGYEMPEYQSILDGIRQATAHLKPPAPTSAALKDVDLERYELCLDLGKPYFILFPKNPDTHKVLSRMHARRMSSSFKALLDPWLEKLSRSFSCFSLEYGDGYDGYGLEFELYEPDYGSAYDEDWNPDYTACSSDDCGMCGKCDY